MGTDAVYQNGNGRRPDGRFLKGQWKGGPGNPYAARVARLKNAALLAVEPDVYAGIVRKMAELALKGDVSAAIFVRDTLVGKPTPLPPPDGEEDGGKTQIEIFAEMLSYPDLRDRVIADFLGQLRANRKKENGAS